MIINLSKISDVKEFVHIAQECADELLLKSKDGKYIVDAKSILGIFSLDLSQELELIAADNILSNFSKFQV